MALQQMYALQIFTPQPVSYLFSLWQCLLESEKFKILIMSILSIFPPCMVDTFCILRCLCLPEGCKDFLLCFLFAYRSFIVFAFLLKCIIHFELIFFVWYKVRVAVFFLYGYPVVPAQLLQRLSFPHRIMSASLSEISWLCMHGSISGLFWILTV